MKHTKGPWKVRSVSQYDVVSKDEFIVACDNVALPDSECIANAKLIAAAPEMLEALELVLSFVMEVGNSNPKTRAALNICTAAIKKARGE
jgi:hypothetical protein